MAKKPFPFKVCEQCCVGGGGDITIDTAMSDTSENAVQNKVIKKYVDEDIKPIYANGLCGEVIGTTVNIDDISPFEHTVDVKVSSKNILPFPYDSIKYGNPRTVNGLTYTIYDDGSVVLDGTPTATLTISLYSQRAAQTLMRKGETYTASLQNNPKIHDIYISNNASTDGTSWDTTIGGNAAGKASMSYTIAEDYKGVQLYIVITKNAGLLENVTIYPQIEESTAATDYTQYVPDVAGVTLKVQDVNGVEVAEHTAGVDGNIEITSISPAMALTTDTTGISIKAKYNKDTNKVIENLTNAIIALGGNV
jgi:hypothetical protein